MKPEDIRDRSFKFALRIIALSKELPRNDQNRILTNQVLRSATSIGANLEEAQGGHSRREFASSTNIAKKEARETYYWLRLIAESNSKQMQRRMVNVIQESEEIIKILTVIVKKTKSNGLGKI